MDSLFEDDIESTADEVSGGNVVNVGTLSRKEGSGWKDILEEFPQ